MFELRYGIFDFFIFFSNISEIYRKTAKQFLAQFFVEYMSKRFTSRDERYFSVRCYDDTEGCSQPH